VTGCERITITDSARRQSPLMRAADSYHHNIFVLRNKSVITVRVRFHQVSNAQNYPEKCYY